VSYSLLYVFLPAPAYNMNCPKCGHEDSKVLDTRTGRENRSIRRRRQCLACGHRFTTLEETVREGFLVIKKDGRR